MEAIYIDGEAIIKIIQKIFSLVREKSNTLRLVKNNYKLHPQKR